MANNFYNRNSSFNPDELADGDAIEAEFDAVARGFDTIEDLVNANQAGYPEQTFHVAPATLDTHAVPKAQMETALSFKLDAVNYSASDILSKLKTVDGSSSGLDADLLDGQEGAYYRNASNINAGTIAKERLPASIDTDLLDGQHGSYYRDASNINAGTLAKERLPASIDASTTGNAATATKVAGTATGTGTADLVTGSMADSDYVRMRVGGSASDAGWMEIATADNGNEPIYVRQYNGQFVSVVRTLTLLDGDGNTILPGKLKAESSDGGVELSGNNTGIYTGNGDGASSNINNLKLSSWFGIGFGPSISGQPVPLGEYSHWFNVRTGGLGCRGLVTAGNGELKSVAVLSGTIGHGNTIPLPSGFTEAQCKWLVSVNDSNSGGDTWDLRDDVTANQYYERCYTTGRVVYCYTVVQEDYNDNAEIHTGIANYIIIGVK